MSDSFMQLRCKAGDIAFITNDEIGCEVNIGRIVKVIGNLEIDEYGQPEWSIKPLHDESWHVLTKSGIQCDRAPFTLRIGHQDSWLLPIRRDSINTEKLNCEKVLEVENAMH